MLNSVKSWSVACGLRLNRLDSSVSFILGFCTPAGVSRVICGAPISACLHCGSHSCFRSDWDELEATRCQQSRFCTSHQRQERGWTSRKYRLSSILKTRLNEVYPNVFIALRIMLNYPDTVARSFSKLKLIKTFNRSHLTDSRLSSLAMLSIEASCVRSLDLNDVIKAFAG